MAAATCATETVSITSGYQQGFPTHQVGTQYIGFVGVSIVLLILGSVSQLRAFMQHAWASYGSVAAVGNGAFWSSDRRTYTSYACHAVHWFGL